MHRAFFALRLDGEAGTLAVGHDRFRSPPLFDGDSEDDSQGDSCSWSAIGFLSISSYIEP